VVELGPEEKLGAQESAGHEPRDGDLPRAEPCLLLLERGIGGWPVPLERHEHRAVAVTHARSARKQGILVEQMGVSVDRDGREMEFATHGTLIERLDVLEDVMKLVAHQVDLLGRHRVEHEGVIGIG